MTIKIFNAEYTMEELVKLLEQGYEYITENNIAIEGGEDISTDDVSIENAICKLDAMEEYQDFKM